MFHVLLVYLFNLFYFIYFIYFFIEHAISFQNNFFLFCAILECHKTNETNFPISFKALTTKVNYEKIHIKSINGLIDSRK